MAVALLAVACVAAWFYFSSSRRHYRAEELLPAETLLFLDIPNTASSRQRFAGTALGKIWAEPEVQAFIEQPLRTFRQTWEQNSEGRTIVQNILRMLATARGEAFLACTDVSISPGLNVTLIAGFDPGDQRKQAEQALERLMIQCRIEYPNAVLEERKFESETYQVWSPSKKVKIAFARVGNFFLFSRGEEPLQQAILRAQGKRKDRLAGAPSFAARRTQSVGSDALMFLNLQPLVERIKLLASFQPGLREQIDSMLPFQTLLGASSFKDGGIEDHLWTVIPGARQNQLSTFQKCDRSSLKATSADAILYATINLDLSKWYGDLKKRLGPNGDAILNETLAKALGPSPMRGIQLDEDILGLMGPELTFLLEWNESSGIAPSLIVQTHDAAKSRAAVEKLFVMLEPKWLEALKKEGAHSPSPGRATGNTGTQNPSKSRIYSLKSAGLDGKSFSPAFAVTDSWVIISLSAASVEKALSTLEGRTPSLATRPEFQTASSRFTKEGYLFIYCDPKRLFEPLYKLVDWAVSLAGRKEPGVGKYVDLSKLPRNETISRHLFPSVHVQGLESNGTHQSSFGPISLSGLTLGGLGAAISQAEKETSSR